MWRSLQMQQRILIPFNLMVMVQLVEVWKISLIFMGDGIILQKTSMKKLLLKGGDLQVFQYKTSEAKELKKRLKKYGILYTELPDINKKDGMSEIIFHAEAVPRMNMIAKKLTHGKIGSFDEYVQNGDEKELEKLIASVEKQMQKAAADLNFEAAAQFRDKMRDLKVELMKLRE